MKQIAIYGKGGIGKSTTAQNLAAALAEKGRRILLIGCDPKADSTRLILGEKNRNTALGLFVEKGDAVKKEEIVRTGFNGIDCVEAGGPEPGTGCAGRGISISLSLLSKLGVYDGEYDYIIYDVLGDVVCGGFSTPMREGRAEEVYIICSGEMMSIYAANNICKGIRKFAEEKNVKLGGLICNARNTAIEDKIVSFFCEKIGAKLLGTVPRDNIMQKAELSRQTILQYAPSSSQADEYRKLAACIEDNQFTCVPAPMDEDAFEAFETEMSYCCESEEKR